MSILAFTEAVPDIRGSRHFTAASKRGRLVTVVAPVGSADVADEREAQGPAPVSLDVFKVPRNRLTLRPAADTLTSDDARFDARPRLISSRLLLESVDQDMLLSRCPVFRSRLRRLDKQRFGTTEAIQRFWRPRAG